MIGTGLLLMLKKEVVEDIKKGKFHVYPVETIDQALEVMTGKEAGTRGVSGKFKRGTVNYLVDKKLKEYAEDYRKFGRQASPKKGNGTYSDSSLLCVRAAYASSSYNRISSGIDRMCYR